MNGLIPIQVLMVYYEPFPSGQTTHVLSLAEGLDHTRFQVRVFMPNLLASVASQFEEVGVEVILAPFYKIYWEMAAKSSLFKNIKDHPNAILHFHSQEAALIGRPLAKLAGAKHILYTPQTIDIRQKRYQKIYRLIEVLLAKITDKILSVNEVDRCRLNTWGIPKEKIVTLYNGIDLRKFEGVANLIEARMALGVEPGAPLVMQIGRMSAQKSPFDFVEGASIVLKTHPEVQFVIIGEGPLLTAVRQKVQVLGLERQIKVVGAIENAYRFIPAADIFTLTSLWEGSPYSLLEAMAFSKPVIATSVNGCPEIVGPEQNALLVPPGDPPKWAEAVVNLINCPQKACAFGHKGRQRVEENFTLTNMVRKIENLYQQTIAADR